jgi:hypothetical protein
MSARPVTLYMDQYGNHFYARTLKELRAQISGRVSIMYVDTPYGTMRTGYVVGQLWLTAYRAHVVKP